MAGEFIIKNGVIIPPLAGNTDKVVTVQANGKLQIGPDFTLLSTTESVSANLQSQIDSLDTQFVSITGDTMTGDLTISTLASNDNEIVTLDTNGKLQTSNVQCKSVQVESISGNTDLDSFIFSDTLGTCEWQIVISDGTNLRSSKINSSWLGGTLLWSEYGVMENSPYSGAIIDMYSNGTHHILRINVSSGTHKVIGYRHSLNVSTVVTELSGGFSSGFSSGFGVGGSSPIESFSSGFSSGFGN